MAPFLRSRDEPPESVFGDYRWCFNISNKTLRYQFLDRLKKAGMKKLFCGHWHRNAGGFDEDLEVRPGCLHHSTSPLITQVIVTSAVGCQLGADTHGCRVVKVLEDRITHEYFALDDLPAEVDLTTPDFP